MQYKKSGAVFLYFDSFYTFILADNSVVYLAFVIIYDNLLKYIYQLQPNFCNENYA